MLGVYLCLGRIIKCVHGVVLSNEGPLWYTVYLSALVVEFHFLSIEELDGYLLKYFARMQDSNLRL